jgi:hypothetical protein
MEFFILIEQVQELVHELEQEQASFFEGIPPFAIPVRVADNVNSFAFERHAKSFLKGHKKRGMLTRSIGVGEDRLGGRGAVKLHKQVLRYFFNAVKPCQPTIDVTQRIPL